MVIRGKGKHLICIKRVSLLLEQLANLGVYTIIIACCEATAISEKFMSCRSLQVHPFLGISECRLRYHAHK